MKRTRTSKRGKTGVKPEILAEWRARIPEMRRLVEDVMPRMLGDGRRRDRFEKIPESWRSLVTSMQRDVHADAEKAVADDESLAIQNRRGYAWNFKVSEVSHMLDFLMDTICRDIGVKSEEEENASLASIVLVQKSLLHLSLELQDGGSHEGREDGEENRFRVMQALKALTPRFDDTSMRRFRALHVAESAAKFTRPLMSEDELTAHVDRIRENAGTQFDEDRHREYAKFDQPVSAGVLARSWLSEIDEAFAQLDPIMVFEEFSEAEASARGGTTEDGEGRIGAVRAIARLAVTCNALDYGQRDDENFDTAVDRARANLLLVRSRIRKALRTMPGLSPDDELDGHAGDAQD